MKAFTYDALPGRVVFGAGASRDKLAEEVGRLDAERVLLVATEQGRELAEDLASPLGERLAGLFTGVRPHVPVEVAEKARAGAGGGIHHKICHVLGGAYDLPHAETHTVILPQAVAFNEGAIPEVMQRVARALGAEEAAAGLYDLARSIRAPTALKDIGMKEENLDEAVTLILEEASRENPRPVDEAGIRELLEDAYSGRRPGVVAKGGREHGLQGD